MTDLSKQVSRVATIARNRTEKEVIEDLMQMQCNLLSEPAFIEVAFPNTLYRFGPGFRQELSYYKHDPKAWDELQKLSLMFMQAIAEAEPFTDHMTKIYDMEVKGDRLGQFLTPPDLADMLAHLTLSIAPPITRPHTIGDDTGCGAGSLVLGLIKTVLKTQGKGAVSMLDVIANDLDAHMAKICTVQVVLNSCIHRIPLRSVRVMNGNILTEYDEMNEGKHMLYQWHPNTPDRLYQAAHKATGSAEALMAVMEQEREPETV